MTQIFPSPAPYAVVYTITDGAHAGTYLHLNQTGYMVESTDFWRDHPGSVLLNARGMVWNDAFGWVNTSTLAAGNPQAIRAQLAALEGELARLSDEPILIWSSWHGDCADIPPGGALLTVSWAGPAESTTRWYPSLEAAKAALLLIARAEETAPDESGLNVDLTRHGCGSSRAYITRRES